MKHTTKNSSGEAKGSRNSDMIEESQQEEAQLTDEEQRRSKLKEDESKKDAQLRQKESSRPEYEEMEDSESSDSGLIQYT